MLAALHYDVISAEDGVEGIEKLLEHDAEVDVVLMDQSMPRKDGVAATQAIRALEGSGQLSRRRPIIAVTAAVNARAQVRFKEAGADEFLAKPLSMAHLGETLAKYTSSAENGQDQTYIKSVKHNDQAITSPLSINDPP